jgi:hypothetical protein
MNKYHTLVSDAKFEHIQELSCQCNSLDGDMAELGIYRGGITKYLAETYPNKLVYAFDTFDGFKDIDYNYDSHCIESGWYADANYTFVINYLNNDNIRICSGYFPDTIPIESIKYCFVHLDSDTYNSITNGLQYFYTNLVSSGIILIDDYNNPNTLGVTKAVNQFCEENHLECIVYPLNENYGTHAYIQKMSNTHQ